MNAHDENDDLYPGSPEPNLTEELVITIVLATILGVLVVVGEFQGLFNADSGYESIPLPGARAKPATLMCAGFFQFFGGGAHRRPARR